MNTDKDTFGAKVCILEGLPGVGKTTLLEVFQSRYGAKIINELITKESKEESNKNKRQLIFAENDIAKMKAARHSLSNLTIMDRGILSTLAYNFTNFKLTCNTDFIDTLYSLQKELDIIRTDPNIYIYYLRGNFLLRDGQKNVYGTLENLKTLEEITILLGKSLCKNFKVIEYDFLDVKSIGSLLNEVSR